jgi:hypothetical protein
MNCNTYYFNTISSGLLRSIERRRGCCALFQNVLGDAAAWRPVARRRHQMPPKLSVSGRNARFFPVRETRPIQNRAY